MTERLVPPTFEIISFDFVNEIGGDNDPARLDEYLGSAIESWKHFYSERIKQYGLSALPKGAVLSLGEEETQRLNNEYLHSTIDRCSEELRANIQVEKKAS